MVAVISTLVAVAIVGLLFSSTRFFGLAALGILVFMFPPTLVLIALAIAIYFSTRKH